MSTTAASRIDLDTLSRARHALSTRTAWSAFAERPDRGEGAEEAMRAAAAELDGLLGSTFVLDQPYTATRVGVETSPYTGEPLGISYPVPEVDVLLATGRAALESWRQVPWERRVELCVQMVDRLHDRLLTIAHANTHTTGQSLSMSCVGSGSNALDRGLEALAQATEAMGRVIAGSKWSKSFGSTSVHLDKRFHLVPRGIAVVVTCASFPTWNAYPALLANLATGNPVIVKPHPTSILTMALAVQSCQQVLAEAGLPPGIVQLAADHPSALLADALVTSADCAIVDFTGSPSFGAWIERNAHPALTFTETAGVNTVVLESVDDLSAVADALAMSMCLFSAQMCTSVQNVYLPRQGVRTPTGIVSVAEVEQSVVAAIRAITESPRRAAATLGAVQSQDTVDRMRALAEVGAERGRVLLGPSSYPHPEHPAARTCTPLVLGVDTTARDLYAQEQFGPVSFLITCEDAEDALAQAVSDVQRAGAIASHLYTTDEDLLERGTQAYWAAGASLTCNLTGPMPLNFSAAYSDYHVTGLGPAGNACLTDEAFVAGRFRIVQRRLPVAMP